MAREIPLGGRGGDPGANIARVLRAGRSGIPRDLERAGVRLVSQLRLDLSKPGTGQVYTHYLWTDRAGRVRPGRPRNKPHRASAPGQTPAVDTGQLRASYGHKVTRTASGGELQIASGSEYAPYLEFGTSRMAPRPHLRPLFARHGRLVTREVADGIEGRERAMARRLGGTG